MDRSQIRRLKTLTLKERPLNSHALAWSCDAELAVATADTIYVFFPEYPNRDSADGDAILHHQFSMYLQAEGIFRPDPVINNKLCALAGIRLPVASFFAEHWRTSLRSVPGREVTGSGSALCNIVSLDWSPSGLGSNLRPVLTALLTSGELLTLGDLSDTDSAAGSALRSRTTKMWKILWGLGANLPIPAENEDGAYRLMEEHIKSFSWAKEVLAGRALLVYANDEDEMVVMSVQHYTRPKPDSSGSEAVWKVREVARFDVRGPHEPVDEYDPDFIPTGSSFSVSWSPWAVKGQSRTAILSYISRNYVGFRRVSLIGHWEEETSPNVEVEPTDTTSLCISLSTDAFVKWEPHVWAEDGQHLGRGIICTPFVTKPFQVSLTDNASPPVKRHTLTECGTSWYNNSCTNPITDLVIHPPKPNSKPRLPLYSLVRSSATPDNKDWFETNAVPEYEKKYPQWAEYVKRATSRLIPQDAAPDTVHSDTDSSVSEEADDEDEARQVAKTTPHIHPYRFRFWGLALSPGGGSTAVLISRYSTKYPDRRGMSQLFFGCHRSSGADKDASQQQQQQQEQAGLKLTTEGRVWEWMYGGGPNVVELASNTAAMDPSLSYRSDLGNLFQDVKANQKCVFCDEKLHNDDYEARCVNNHSFAICSYSGVAVLAPGISHICAVCQRRCLKYSELVRLAKEQLGPEVSVPTLGGSCGGCGGKFVA